MRFRRTTIQDRPNDHEARATCRALQEGCARSERTRADVARQRDAEHGLKQKAGTENRTISRPPHLHNPIRGTTKGPTFGDQTRQQKGGGFWQQLRRPSVSHLCVIPTIESKARPRAARAERNWKQVDSRLSWCLLSLWLCYCGRHGCSLTCCYKLCSKRVIRLTAITKRQRRRRLPRHSIKYLPLAKPALGRRQRPIMPEVDRRPSLGQYEVVPAICRQRGG
jgi:hypothetical protein